MTLGKHECSIILCDEFVGEKEYRIEGTAKLPNSQIFNVESSVEDGAQDFKINIPFEN